MTELDVNQRLGYEDIEKASYIERVNNSKLRKFIEEFKQKSGESDE